MKSHSKIVWLYLIFFIYVNLFAQSTLSEAVYFIENNAIENIDEIKYNPKNNFEEDLVNAIIDYKQARFEDAYSLLLPNLNNQLQNLEYYEYLAKSAHVLGKDSELEEVIGDNPKYNYLYGIIEYLNTNYTSAVKKFDEASQAGRDLADILIYLSSSYRKLGDYDKAVQVLERSQSLVEKSDPKYAEILVAKGSLFFLSGQYEKAKEIYEAGLKLAKESQNNVEVIKSNLNLGMISDLYGESNLAQQYFQKAYTLAKTIDQKELEATVLTEWGVSFTYLSMPIEARDKYEESYKIFEELKNYDRMALAAINVANQYLNINNYQSALKHFNLGLDLAGENLRTKMLAYRGLGDVYTNLSNYATALEYYNKAKDISNKLKDISAETEINIGIGTLFYNLRNYNEALDVIMDTYDSIDETVNPYLKAELNQKAGIINLSLSNYDEAEKYLSNSIKLSDEYGDIYSSILSNTYLANVFVGNKNAAKGKEILLNQIDLCNEYSLNQLLGVQYLILSEASNGQDKLNYLNKAKENSLLANDESNLIEIYTVIGKYYTNVNEIDKAENQFINAIVLVEKTHQALGSNGKIQIDYFSDKSDVYKSLANLYLLTGEDQKAFAVIDKSRSRNTTQNLSDIKIGSSKKEHLVKKYYDLNWQLLNNLVEEDKSEAAKLELAKLAGELGSKINDISAKSIRNEIENYFNTITLSDDETFIKYFVDSSDVYVFILNKNDFKLVKLTTEIDDISKNISLISPYYNSEFNNNEISFNKDLFSFKSDESHKLYKKLLEPIITEVPINSKLIFSLPNELLNIPFEFLVTEEETTASRFLIEDYSISYVPSMAIYGKLKLREQSDNDLALIAGEPNFENVSGASETRGITKLDLYARNINLHPLKYSLDEVETIKQYFRSNLLLLQEEATETNFVVNAEKASVIHLSTHSFLFDNNPVVLLSEDESNDGYLEVGEIAQLKLNSDLVVLSSCKSGLGKIEENEGILGMQKAFFDVGASSVILSLWDVSDEHTAELMKYFYSFLSEGYDKSSALRKAKIKFINEIDPNPYYWSAFVLTGNLTKMNMESKSSSSYWAYFVALLLLAVLYYIIMNRKFINLKMG